ncbi:MAG: protein kinase [Fuerstiella sp.]
MPRSPARTLTCPPADVLAQLVSGSLNEDDAERLFRHIDTCQSCQQKVDDLEKRPAGVLQAARTPAQRASDPQHLNRLIREAQKFGTPRHDDVSGSREAVSVEGFLTGLRRCGLFPPEEIDALLSDVESSDSSSLARELVGRRKLTPFQARVLLKGRWKGLVLGNYVILDKLGQGGMGSVFKARHRRLGRIVCVKVINSAGRRSPKMLERFRNEAKTVAALSHPNFVVAHDADEAEGVPFLVMEYVEGSDLSRHVANHGPLTLHRALQIVHQAATALQYAHDQGVTHRDIKPHNLLITDTDESDELHVKILDLGLARFDSLLGDEMRGAAQAAVTNTGVIMGTVDYMSPEQALRSRDADNRSDIYSLGCTLHYLVTGEPVFVGDTLMARLIAHREAPLPSLEKRCPGAMPHLDAVFHRMLAKAPADRYQSMEEVARDTEALLTGQTPQAVEGPSAAVPVSVLDQRRQLQRRMPYGFLAAIGSVFCMFAVMFFALAMQRNESSAGRTSDSFPDQSTTQAGADVNIGADSGNRQLPPTISVPSGMIAGIYGDFKTMSEGGLPRGVVIVPQRSFDDRELLALQTSAEKYGIQLTVAAPQGTTLNPLHDQNFSLTPDVQIDQLSVDNFDIIFLVGGSVEDLETRYVSDQLSHFLISAGGMGRVIAASSAGGVRVLQQLTSVADCRTHQQQGVFFGRPASAGGAIVWSDRPEITDLVVRKSLQLRRAILNPGIHQDTLAKVGAGRALVVVPRHNLDQRHHELLTAVCESRGVNPVWASAMLGDAESGDGQKVPVTHSLQEIAALNPGIRFSEQFDYVILVGGNLTELQQQAGESIQRVVEHALRDGSVVIALSKDAKQLLQVCDEVRGMKFKPGPAASVGRMKDHTGAVVWISEVSSAAQLTKILEQAEQLRRDALTSAQRLQPEVETAGEAESQ